jgi:acyl-CoA reductase-like NAD-dependent aldehyde dehydrogenase
MKTLASYLAGDWHLGAGPAITLVNPATEEPLALVHGHGLDLGAALAHARGPGRSALAALTFAERGALLAALAPSTAPARSCSIWRSPPAAIPAATPSSTSTARPAR